MKKPFAQDARVLIQGMTGREGIRMAEWMQKSGVNVVAGVTPGKGGQRILDRPIFDSVKMACTEIPGIAASCVVVPASRVQDAALEALRAGIKMIHILSEQVPVHDVLAIRAEARQQSAIVLGPSSVGFLQFPKFRLGYLGGEDPFSTLIEGDLALVSTSGGMANEILHLLSRSGVGCRVAIAVGGDRVPGTTLWEAVQIASAWDKVRAVAVFAEPGNPLVLALADGTFIPDKPMTVMLPGDGMEILPRSLPYGHTGTILGEDAPPLEDVRRQIRAHGSPCSSTMNEFYSACKQILSL